MEEFGRQLTPVLSEGGLIKIEIVKSLSHKGPCYEYLTEDVWELSKNKGVCNPTLSPRIGKNLTRV